VDGDHGGIETRLLHGDPRRQMAARTA
jgi:hypothetical protein